MTIRSVITPTGNLIVETVDDSDVRPATSQAATLQGLQTAFEDSSAAGLLSLASGSLLSELPAEFVYWREFAQRFFHELCGLGEEELRKAVASSKARTALSSRRTS
jgi:hypothetical protein